MSKMIAYKFILLLDKFIVIKFILGRQKIQAMLKIQLSSIYIKYFFSNLRLKLVLRIFMLLKLYFFCGSVTLHRDGFARDGKHSSIRKQWQFIGCYCHASLEACRCTCLSGKQSHYDELIIMKIILFFKSETYTLIVYISSSIY